MPVIAKRKRFFVALEGIRGMCAILISVFHAALIFNCQGLQAHMPGGYLAVDIFFLLSGVVIANAYEQRLLSSMSATRFAMIRAIRLYPLYALGCAITIIGMTAGYIPGTDFGHLLLLAALASFLLPCINPGYGHIFPLNNPSWTLFFEILVNIAYAAFIRFINIRNLLIVMGVSALGMTCGLLTGHTHSLNIGWTLKGLPFGLFRVSYSFSAGILIHRLYKSATAPKMLRRYSPACLLSALMVIVLLSLIAAPSESLRPFFDIFSVMLVFPAVIYAALWLEPSGLSARLCRFFGAISYAVYAIHHPVYKFVSGYLKQPHGVFVADYLFYAGMSILALLPVCWLLDKVYDYPVRKFLMPVKG